MGFGEYNTRIIMKLVVLVFWVVFGFIFYTFRGVCVSTSATGGQRRGSNPLEQALESRVTRGLGSVLLSS